MNTSECPRKCPSIHAYWDTAKRLLLYISIRDYKFDSALEKLKKVFESFDSTLDAQSENKMSKIIIVQSFS